MGDMAFVWHVSHISDLVIDAHRIRFGGGFELMTKGDEDGVWALISSSLKFATPLSPLNS